MLAQCFLFPLVICGCAAKYKYIEGCNGEFSSTYFYSGDVSIVAIMVLCHAPFTGEQYYKVFSVELITYGS